MSNPRNTNNTNNHALSRVRTKSDIDRMFDAYSTKSTSKSGILTPPDISKVLARAYTDNHTVVQQLVAKAERDKGAKRRAETSNNNNVIVGHATESTAPGFELWLPFAAKQLQISPNAKDYLLYIVPVMPSDLPNANGVGFPARELFKWNRSRGALAYQTMQRMPMHIEHDSDDMTTAAGVVIDTAMTRLTGFADDKLWKMMSLVAIDIKKSDIAQKFDSGEMNTYSMGAMVENYYCSYCGATMGDCSHIQEDSVAFYELDGKLVYKLVTGIEFFEFSMVADPAYGMAQSDIRLKGFV